MKSTEKREVFLPEQNETNNYTSKINVFTVSRTIFVLLGG